MSRRSAGTWGLARRGGIRCLGIAAVVLVARLAPSAAGQPPLEDAGGLRERRAEAEAKAAARLQRGLALQNPATEAYDASFYKLEIDLDPVARWLTGSVTMQARAVQAPLASVQLDLDDSLRVDAASAGGAPTTFDHSGGIVTVALDRSYGAGEPFEIALRYQGLPDTRAGGFHFDSHQGQPLVWTLSEPFGARTWWPCKDTPADKADSVDVDLTVPSDMIAVSQGKLLGTAKPDPVRTTYRWRERYPIATYLVSIAAHAYTAQTVSYTPLAGGSMPVTVWSYPEQAEAARSAADATLAVLQRFAGLFGEYPFVREKYGYAQCNFGGGMEHQTVTSLGGWSTGLVVHETAHQWFGDAVTCGDFSDIWLNEGFATYCEALWAEGQGGLAAYRDDIWWNRYYGPGTIWVPEPEGAGFGRIFDGNLSYNKGSWVLHMLRGLLGDGVFFEVLRAWLRDPQVAYGSATTEDFQRVAETVSGRDLSRFFTNWIHRPYFPSYLYDFSTLPRGGGWEVHLDVEQLQTQALYDMPIGVRILTTAGAEDHVVRDSLALQSFDLQVGAEPTGVQLDPDRWILHTSERALHEPSFDRGVLVVNGVSWWSPFAAEVTSSYADSVFAGRYPFSFWDWFPAPPGGYVPQLPAPLGHGPLPPEVLGQFSTVVWVGNIWADDLDGWNQASIVSYLRQGGNVLLLARRGQEFLSPARSAWLGLRWAENPVATLGAARPARADLVPMTTTDAQSQCAVFETDFDQPETQLLLTDDTHFSVPRGIAAWRRPAAGGTLRSKGGNFAFVSGRPYRWEHAALRTNVRSILSNLFEEVAQTPVLATLEATPEAQGMRLAWRLADAESARLVQLQRRTAEEPLRNLARWDAGERHGSWIDGGVRAGRRYTYVLSVDSGSGPKLVAERDAVWNGEAPIARTRLLPVAPNPFNPGVEVRWELAQAGPVTLRVFDARGRLVRTLLAAERPRGAGTCVWDGRADSGRHAPSGVYMVRMRSNGVVRSVKATLAR